MEFGLEVLESRQSGRGSRESKPSERASAARRGQTQTDRVRLERIVRACAAAAGDEAEFVRTVVARGARIRPRFAKGRRDIVEGYSVALRTRDGSRASWYGGGRLARDLTLTRLRQAWPDTPESAHAAVRAWTRVETSSPPRSRPAEIDVDALRRCEGELARMREFLRTISPTDRAQWAQVAHDAAGVFAAWSLQVEPTPGPLSAASVALARSAQVRAYEHAGRPPAAPSVRGTALVLASIARGGLGPVAQAAMLRQLFQTGAAVAAAHRAAGEARQAAELARTLRREYEALGGARGSRSPSSAPAEMRDDFVRDYDAQRTLRESTAHTHAAGPNTIDLRSPKQDPRPPRRSHDVDR